MFEPGARIFGRKIAGKGIANPVSSLLSGVELLRFLELYDHADLIEDAVLKTLEDDCLTKDMGGTATTKEFTMNVIEIVQSNRPRITLCDFDEPPKIPPPPSEPTAPFNPEIHDKYFHQKAQNLDGDSCSEND